MADNQIHIIGEFRREEALASGSVKPGHLVEMTSAAAPTVKAHSVAGGHAERAFAVEDALQGNTVDTTYTTGKLVSFNLEQPGNVVQARFAISQDVDIGDDLISAGDGTLAVATEADSDGGTQKIIAKAVEDSGGALGAETLLKVRLL